ncbi:MAG: hypothetical protein R3304_04735, partial [Longimicrobiales bacterium]|nr:hypothetical protein [Longimicrobiales bacterium]
MIVDLLRNDLGRVAEFGSALAVRTAGGRRLTETGLTGGTPYYKSPEQATGDQVVGAASDTYALACVLYEMLVGEPPYLGNTAQAVLGKIIQGAPVSATAARKSIPRNVDAAIRKALERLPADRFRSASAFTAALADPTFRHGEEADRASAFSGGGSRGLLLGGWGAAAVLAGVLAWVATRPEPVQQVRRFSMPFEEGQELEFIGANGFELSPEGSLLVYRHIVDGNQVLVSRRWDELEAVPIRGTEGASFPALSPDGTELAFESPDGGISVLALAGGPVRTLGEGIVPVWGPDGFVYFTSGRDVLRAPAAGGAREVLLSTEEGEGGHFFTDVLASGDRAIRAVNVDGGFQLRILDLETLEEKSLTFGLWGKYATTGHLLYLSEGVLMAAALDEGTMELTGPGVPILDDVLYYSLGTEGTLFYSGGSGAGGTNVRPVWIDRSGDVTPVDPGWIFDRTANPNDIPSLSPDGTRLAVREFTEDGYDIWIKHLPTGVHTRLTMAEKEDRMAVWHPDGRDIAFVSSRDGDRQVWTRRADGTGEPRLLVEFDMPVANMSWTPDGSRLLLRTAGTGGVEGGRDIYVWNAEQGGAPEPLLAANFDEGSPTVSPDGRWLAYTSNESNRWEVYVRPFPDVDEGRWQVSVDGGRTPKWSSDGRELFFVDANDNFVVSTVSAAPSFQATPPETLFQIPPAVATVDLSVPYDVAPDDQRFVMYSYNTSDTDGGDPDVVLVENFFQELRARAPR